MNYKELFNLMHPDFFKAPWIRDKSEDAVFSELILDLKKEGPSSEIEPCPENISFGFYQGDLKNLQPLVARVDEGWVQFYDGKNRIFCAYDGDKIAAFCIIDDWGEVQGLRIAGPGCVGTVPEYRKQGIGLVMVRKATEIIQKEGYDLSWIHYTHLGKWYSKLGYHTILQWNCKGFID